MKRLNKLQDKELFRTYRWPFIALVCVLIILCSGILIIHLKNRSTLISKQIISKAAFSIFYPSQSLNMIKAIPSSVAFDQQSDGLSYNVAVHNKTVYVSEQATPDVFSQSGVYDYKLNQAHEYDSFETSAGEVALTKPTGLNNQTLAWINSKGTLTLARATSTLTETEWKQLFNSMTVVN